MSKLNQKYTTISLIIITLLIGMVLVWQATVKMQSQKNMIKSVADEINQSMMLAPLTMKISFNVETPENYATCDGMNPVINIKSNLFYKLDPKSARLLLLMTHDACLKNI